MLVEHVKDNYYAKTLATIGREKHTLVFYSQWSVKCRSMVSGQDACLLSVSRMSTVQGFIILAIIGIKKHT